MMNNGRLSSKIIMARKKKNSTQDNVDFSKKTSGFWRIPALFLVDKARFYGIASSKCPGMPQKSDAEYAPPLQMKSR